MPCITIHPRDIEGSSVRLRDQAAIHHLVHVLRARPGDAVDCIDGAGRRYATRFARRAGRELVLEITGRRDESPSGLSIWLVQALIRPERFDWLVQKATELGVERLTPVVTDRTVVRIPADGAAGKVARWQRIATEAAQQCGRATIPRIDPPARLADVVTRLPDQGVILIPTLAAHGPALREALGGRFEAANAAVLIGPEGDFTPEEVALARRHGARAVSLGRRVLRSETAALAVLAVLRHAAGEL